MTGEATPTAQEIENAQMRQPSAAGEVEAHAAILAVWDAFATRGGFRPATRAEYRRIAQRFLRWLESQGIGLGQISAPVVRQFLDAQHVSPSTKSLYLAALCRFFDALVCGSLIPTNPEAGTRRRPGAGVPRTGSLADQFASFTAVERQATVDAAAFALLLHDISLLTEGQGGCAVDVARCDETLQLGECYGITPYSWAEKDTQTVTGGAAAPGGVESPDPEPLPDAGPGTAA